MARWRYDAQPLLRYATMPEAPLYREIMEVFAEAAELIMQNCAELTAVPSGLI
jgi:hypothetical protein